MALRFQCPACKVVKAANERLLGREIKCPECGAAVQLPSQEQIDASKREKAEQERQMVALQAALKSESRPAVATAAPILTATERMEAEQRTLDAASATFKSSRAGSGEDMDMTPMVDVTFLLLIFFMITASFAVQKTIQRPAPREEDPSTQAVQRDPEDNPDIVTVQVDEFNAYNIVTTDWDRICGSKQDLIVGLNEAHNGDSSGNQPTKLVIQAHEDCIHASVIAALDAGREAQFESFEVSTVEQFD